MTDTQTFDVVQKKREKKRRRREKKTVMKDDVTFYYFFDSSFTTYLPHKRKQRRRILLLIINNTCAWLRRALKLSEGFPCPLPLSPALREEDFYHDEEDDEREEEATEVLPFACWGRCSMRSPGKGVPTRRKCRRRTFTSYRMGPTSTGTRSSTHP